MTENNQKFSKVSEITSVEDSTVDNQEFEIADNEEVETNSKKLKEQNLENEVIAVIIDNDITELSTKLREDTKMKLIKIKDRMGANKIWKHIKS